MAQKGQSIENKKTGEKIIWRETAKDTNGQRLVFDFEVAPLGKLPAIHFHPNQVETFQVHKGNFVINLNGKHINLKAGDQFSIEKGIPHQWWNESPTEPAQMTVTFEPALNTETFLEQFYGLGNADKTRSDGTPSFLQIMAMANEYELYIAGPPLPIQKLLSFVVGGFARLIGFKKYYPEFSSTPT